MSKHRSKNSKKHNSKYITQWNGKPLDHRTQGMLAGIKWAKRASHDLFSYAYFKLCMDESHPKGLNPISFFLDPEFSGNLKSNHRKEINAILDDACKGGNSVSDFEILARVGNDTVAWLRGWLVGIRMVKEAPENAEGILRNPNGCSVA